jgi:hypothetical protein
VDEASEQMVEAKSVIIVPGYGVAVAKAQYAMAEITKMLTYAFAFLYPFITLYLFYIFVVMLASRYALESTQWLVECQDNSTCSLPKLVCPTMSCWKWRRSTTISTTLVLPLSLSAFSC